MQRCKMLGKISGLGHFCDGTVSFSQKKLLSAIFKLFLCQKYLFKSPDFLKPVNMSIILDISKKKFNPYHNWKSNMAATIWPTKSILLVSKWHFSLCLNLISSKTIHSNSMKFGNLSKWTEDCRIEKRNSSTIM